MLWGISSLYLLKGVLCYIALNLCRFVIYNNKIIAQTSSLTHPQNNIRSLSKNYLYRLFNLNGAELVKTCFVSTTNTLSA